MYFWENDLVELKLICRELIDNQGIDFFYDNLRDTSTRFQADKGISLPVSDNTAADMMEYACEAIDEGDEIWFCIFDKSKNILGYATISWMNEKAGNAQIFISIKKEYRESGFGKAAANILLEYLFMENRYNKIGATVLDDNEAGREFLLSIGFKLEGYRKDMFFYKGTYHGEYYFGILKDEYRVLGSELSKYSFEENVMELEKYKESITKLVMASRSERFTNDAEEATKVKDNVKDNVKEKKRSLGVDSRREYYWEYEDIYLAEMTEEACIKMHELVYDTEACVFFDSDVKLPVVREELNDFEKSHLNFGCDDNRIEFAIYNSEGEFIGNINICGLDKSNGKFSFSICIIRDYQGYGYSTKSLKMILYYCFNELRMNKMISCVNEGNFASAAMMLSVGCKCEGRLRADSYYHGEYHDTYLFGVSTDEFFENFE